MANFESIIEEENPQEEQTPSMAQVIKELVDSSLYDVRVSMPAKVIEYDHETQKVTVQPIFKREYKDGQTIQLPKIYNVPVAFQRAGESIITMPLEKDHYVLLVCCDRSLEKWLSNGGDVTPDDVRHHSLSDAIAIPGVYPFNDPASVNNPNDIIIKNEKGNGKTELRLKTNGHVQILNHKGYDFVKLMDDMLTELRAARVVTGDAGTQPLVNPRFGLLQAKIRTFKE